MMSEDIEFCIHRECKHKDCERHPSRIRQYWFDHSFMDFSTFKDFCKKGGKQNGNNENDSDSVDEHNR